VKPLHLEGLTNMVKAIQDFWLTHNDGVIERVRPEVIPQLATG
jgi:hypothetical protein